MASSIVLAFNAGERSRAYAMSDEDIDESLDTIEGLVRRCTTGFKLTPSAIREVISDVSTITRLSMRLTREMIERVKSLEERHARTDLSRKAAPSHARARNIKGH